MEARRSNLEDCLKKGHKIEVFHDADGIGGTAVCQTCGATEVGLMDELISYQLAQLGRNIRKLEKREEKQSIGELFGIMYVFLCWHCQHFFI
jgi:hypothetical protein